jgi:crotonobetainyl-CoA:carnitine CoA-transferase CaiB-like acyl-CoA transferase
VLAPAKTLVDPHVVAAGFFARIPFPGLNDAAPIVNPPVKLSRSPARLRGRAPTLGEHTDEVLREIGYDDARIAALRREGVV